MNPLGTRTRVEELARLLEGSSATPTAPGSNAAALAMRLQALAPALEPLATPRPAFRSALRTRLLAVAQVQAMAAASVAADAPFAQPVSRPAAGEAISAVAAWTQTRKAQRRLAVTAGAMAGMVAVTGIGMAASRSLPGQPFYGLKRGAESLQLDLTSGDQARGSKHLEFAATRLREVTALAEGHGELSGATVNTPLAAGSAFGGSLQNRINSTLVDFDHETAAGRGLLESVFHKTGKQAPLRILKSFAAEQQTKLTALLPVLPASSVLVAQHSLELVTQVQTTSTEQLALGTCSGECFPGNGGPTLPTQPEPLPGATASPSASDDNGVSGCFCGSSDQPTTAPTATASATEQPTAGPTSSPTPSPTPSATPSATPDPLPIPLPVPVPTVLPTVVPTLTPTPLPVPEPTDPTGLLPTLPLLPTLLGQLFPSPAP